MSNWGTAMPGWGSPPVGMGGDVACPAGTETNCIIAGTGLVLPPPVDYFLLVLGMITISFGASVPTSMTFGCRIIGGADFDVQNSATQSYTANATVTFPFTFVSTTQRVTWANTASGIAVSAIPVGQAVTCRANGSRYVVCALVGFDA